MNKKELVNLVKKSLTEVQLENKKKDLTTIYFESSKQGIRMGAYQIANLKSDFDKKQFIREVTEITEQYNEGKLNESILDFMTEGVYLHDGYLKNGKKTILGGPYKELHENIYTETKKYNALSFSFKLKK